MCKICVMYLIHFSEKKDVKKIITSFQQKDRSVICGDQTIALLLAVSVVILFVKSSDCRYCRH